jgi:molybdopterin-dependent oxidoreductase alpha subunit
MEKTELTYSEQFFLLTIDPVSGKPLPISEQVMHLSLAGALLLDASFRSMINDDWEKLTILKETDSVDSFLDEVIRCLLVFERSLPLKQAVAVVAAHGNTFENLVLNSLIKKGAVYSLKSSIKSAGYKGSTFSLNMPLVIDINRKIREAVLYQDIPDYKIPPLISLIEASGLTNYIFRPEESEKHRERIFWLANIESLGRELVRAVKALENSDLEKDVTALIGMKHDQPRVFAGGIDAVLTSLSFMYKEAGIKRSRKLLANFNQHGGFECTGCAWPNHEKERSHFEFCENGAKNISSLATTKTINSDFFKQWSVEELKLSSDYWLENQGRLTEPMFLDENGTHYKPVSWEDAYGIIAKELNSIENPDQAVFYSSGRTSNEAAFLYQLFARAFGTNNLPNSANLCHEASGKAMMLSLGFGKSSISLDDFSKTDAVFVFGHNPGSNHPRMLNALQNASRKGASIIAVNPMPEASLLGFANPQEALSYFNKYTPLSNLFIQLRSNGDMAFVRGMVKYILENDNGNGDYLDLDFISKYTNGFESYRDEVLNTSWEQIIQNSGLEKNKIIEAAEIYIKSEKVIATWCLGITHHVNAVETIREIVNLLLLKGNIGKPGAGLLPVRGHSNIQGIRTMGVGENMPLSFLESLEKGFSFSTPKKPGLGVIPSIKAVDEGKVKVYISLGGNLASALPDTGFVENAFTKCNLTVNISTKLNRSHLITGRKALILPCFSRLDEDIAGNRKQAVTVEDALCKLSLSCGCIPPPSEHLKSEIKIIGELAKAVLGNKFSIEWDKYVDDYNYLRFKISETFSSLKDLKLLSEKKDWIYLDNPLKRRQFNTSSGKAVFCNSILTHYEPEKEELILMTIRSHDQFNTSIFGLNDRYRGITGERRVLFMNKEDMESRNIADGQMVQITSNYDNSKRKLTGYYAVQYPVSKGSVAAYFPEANRILSINNISEECYTPAYKYVRVKVESCN